MNNYLFDATKIIVVLSVIAGLVFLNNSNRGSKRSEPDFEIGPVPNQQNSRVKQFNMTAAQFEFTPAQIKVSEGDTVRLTIKNLDVAHGFAINELNINQVLPAGKTTTFEFEAYKKGTYRFYCSVVCGSGHLSMVGELIVE